MDSASQAQLDAARISADAMMGAAGMSAEATITGAKLSSSAAKQAASISADASKYATDIQWKMYEQARQDQLPWIESGQRAVRELETRTFAGPGEFTESPGYQFRLNQGNQNILSNQSATGNLASGRTLKALQEYGQDYASYEYDKFLNQYYQSLTPFQSLAGLGQTSAGTLGSQGIATGQAMGSSAMAGAAQQGAAYMSAGNAMAAGYNNLAGIYGNLGNNLASNYMGQGNVIANNYMQQGGIAAQNSIAQGNIWGGVVNDIAMGIGKYYGGSSSNVTKPPSANSTQNAYMAMSYL
jgi:hypothetical protein